MFKTKLSTILILLITILSSGFCGANWNYRSHFEIRYPLKDDLSLGIKPKIWFNEIINDVNSYHLEVGIDKKVNNWFTISSYYRHVIVYNNQTTATEYRPQVDLAFNWKFNRLLFQNRNRIEYRIRTNDSSVRYRNRVLIKYPVKNIWIACGEEPFIDCSEIKCNRNRFYLDLIAPINKNLSTELSYVMEHNRSADEWEKINLIVTSLKLKL